MRYLIIVLSLFIITCGGGGGGSAPTEPTGPTVPTVQNITFTTPEDIPKTFTFTGSDPQNAALTYGISTQPEHGTVVVSGGAATYTPNANYHGTDIFYYIATSVNGNSNIGTIIATITAVDDEPNTMDATATTDEDNAIDISLSAEEYDGDNIQFIIRINPPNGSATISGNIATYTPNQDWYGTDSFTFEAVDVSSKSILNIATATITVNPINDAPIVNDVSAEVNLGASVEINLDGSDVEGDNLTYSVVDSPTNGSVAISGSVATYTPDSGPTANYTFTYKANDGTDDSNTATVTTAVDADPKIEIHPLSGSRSGNEEHHWLYDTDIPLKWDTVGVEKVNIYLRTQDISGQNDALVKTIAVNVPVSDGENEKIINLDYDEVLASGGRPDMYFLITDASDETFQSDPDVSGNFHIDSAIFDDGDDETTISNGHHEVGTAQKIQIMSNHYLLDYYYGEDKPVEIYLYRRGEMLTKIGELSFTWNESGDTVRETLEFIIPTEFGRGAHYDFIAIEPHTGKIFSYADSYKNNMTFTDNNPSNGLEFFTLSFWFKFEDKQGDRVGIYKQSEASGSGLNGAKPFSIKRNGNDEFVIDIEPSDGTELDDIISDAFTGNSDWNFFALTVSDVEDSIKVQVNSSIKKIGNVSSSLRKRFYLVNGNCSNCFSGSEFFGQHDSETAHYDNYAIWSRFMSDAELDDLFNSGRNNDLSSTSDLQLYLPMNGDFKTADAYYDSESISMVYIEGESINKIPLQIRTNTGTFEDAFNKLSFEDGALKILGGHARIFALLDFLN